MRRYKEFERIVPQALTCHGCGRTSEEIFARRGSLAAITNDECGQILVCRDCRKSESMLYPRNAKFPGDER